jgi:uncharacterized protein YbjT (DUF2867 family)
VREARKGTGKVRQRMKIVVIGGTGLIGSKLVTRLRASGHEAVAASPNTGVDTLTGAGLAEVLKGASVVVDVSNSPSFEPTAALEFFQTSTKNQLTHEAAAGVAHHVALSVVGTERLTEIGYFLGKVAQEKLIQEGNIPFSIVRATQFFEFFESIAKVGTVGDEVRLGPVFIQPMAAADVAEQLARVALGAPLRGVVDIAGPDRFRLDEFIRQGLGARKDPRRVVADPTAGYFGVPVGESALVPLADARLGTTHFEDWLR